MLYVSQHLNSLKPACIVTKLFMQHIYIYIHIHLYIIPSCSLSNSFVSIFHWPVTDQVQYSQRQSCLVKIGSTVVPSNCHAVLGCVFPWNKAPGHAYWWQNVVYTSSSMAFIASVVASARSPAKIANVALPPEKVETFVTWNETRSTCSPHSSAHSINRQIKLETRQVCNMVNYI